MDRRRAAGALLALAACVAYSAAAPTASNQTSLDLYEGAGEGCYYNFQHYGEGDRIMTNEPCLNCTCHNRMLMCYLRVCPFTKPIGQDCTVEKRADQCCPIVTCPDVPVDLLTSTSTSSPMEYGATGLGKLDMYGCSINGRYFPEGSKVPSTPNKPCEHCYCIRNMTTCVMQECTLHVDGCTPIYHKDVCCPVRYSCDHPEDEIPLLDDMTTTVRPTQGFLLTTTTSSPVTQMTQDCVHNDKIFPDGALIRTEKACEHCYCMKGDIVCVVQECGTPMENEGKNCTSLAPREGQCCPDTYICEGDDLATGITEISTHVSTKGTFENITPKAVSDEGSGYSVEPEESYTGMPTVDSGIEGSGEEDLDKSLSSSATPPLIDESLETSKDTFDQHPITRMPQPYEITTEPDNAYNTIPSEFSEEKPSVSKTTVSSEGPKVTESTTGNVGKPAFNEESVTSIPDLTTEKSFRKDDQGEVTKESFTQKELEGLATVSADEISVTESTTSYENIASSEKSELQSPSTLTPTHMLHEEKTTEAKEPLIQEKPVKEPVTLNEIGTTVSIPESYDNTESSELDKEESYTTINPGRIPGEGDCLYNGITYRNESDVPSLNKCDLSCKCISSIVKCDPIICSPVPEFMDNCQTVFDTPESCCPTYICQSKETVPPQSHNQMAGTDSPLTKPPTECSDGDCLVTKEKEHHEVLDIPKKTLNCDNEENCTKTNIPEIVPCDGESCTKVKSDCQSAECGTPDVSQKPEDKIEEACLDESCRKKIIGSSESKPSAECSDLECLQEVLVIPTVKPDVINIKPSLTESVTELSSDEYSTEGDLGDKILDVSIQDKEPNQTIQPYQTTEDSGFVQTSSEESLLISYPTKVSTADKTFIASETPETITVKTSSEAENYLTPQTTPSSDSISFNTMISDTFEPNEPVTETNSFDTNEPDNQKPIITEVKTEHINNADSVVTESEPFISSMPGHDSWTELPLSHVTQLDDTELPQEQPKVNPEENVTETTFNEKPEPETFTNMPEYQTDYSLDSKTPEISTEISKTVLTDEENKYLATDKPEETTYDLDYISTHEKEESPTELPELITPVQQQPEKTQNEDESATELTATHLISTDISDNLKHGEEENEIPTKIPDYKVTTESVQKVKEVITEFPETASETKYYTELPEAITSTAKLLIPENDIYTESPEITKPVEMETEAEKLHIVTKPSHYKEEENEIPTELPERKITAEDEQLLTNISESTNDDREEKTELPETMTTYALDHQLETEQHNQSPEKPVYSEGEHSTEILEHTTYEPLSQGSVGYETSKHQPEELEPQTKVPIAPVIENQKGSSLSETNTQTPEIFTSEIPEKIEHEEQELPEISTEKQALTPEISNTVLPEVVDTIESLATTEAINSELYKVTSKLNEEPVTNVYEPSTSILDSELGLTISQADMSLYTRPQSSSEPLTERPEHALKTTGVTIESHSPDTGTPLTSQKIHTTTLPALDVTRYVETGTEKVEPESVTTKLKEPEHNTEYVELSQTEIPSLSTSEDAIVDQGVTEQEIQTEHSIPLDSERPGHFDEEPLYIVTEHKELTNLPEIFTVATEQLPTKLSEIEEINENLPTEPHQIVTSIPEVTSDDKVHVGTTEKSWFVESDQTKQFETGTDDLITNLAETSNPSYSVTETLLELSKATFNEIQVPEIQASTTPTNQAQVILDLQTSTPSSIGETKSFMVTESEVSEVNTVKYEEKPVSDEYGSVTIPNQQMEEGVSETFAPDYVPYEHGIKVQETTPKIKEFSTESQTELPLALVTKVDELSSKPFEMAETSSPEVSFNPMIPDVSNMVPEMIVPSTQIPITEDEFSTKSSEVVTIASPELKPDIENIDKYQESVTIFPNKLSTEDQEINTRLPEIEQHASTQLPILYDSVPGQSNDTDTTVIIAVKDAYTETPEHYSKYADITTESVIEAITKKSEKEFMTEPHKTETITEITPSSPEIDSTKYPEQPESHEVVTEELVSGKVTEKQTPTQKDEYVDTTPYSVELDEHSHGDAEIEKPTHSTLEENKEALEDKNEQATTEKALEPELHDIATTEFTEVNAQTTPHAIIIQEITPVLSEIQEPGEKSSTAIPESDKVDKNVTPASSDSFESHTTISSAFETVETEKPLSNMESNVGAEKDIIKITEKPLGSATVEPSIPEEELILVTTKLTTIKNDEGKSTQSPIETYTNPENEMTEDKSTEIPGLVETHEEKPSKVPDEHLIDISHENPSEIPIEKLSESSEENNTEIHKENPTEAPEKTSYAPEEKPSEITENKFSETPEVKPTEMPKENPSQIPEEIPTVITEENISETPIVKPTISFEDKPAEIYEEKPTAIPISEIPEEKYTEIPEGTVIEIPEDKSTAIPEDNVGEIPKEKPTDISKEKPTTIPDEKPTAIPEETFSKIPADKPTAVPEEKVSGMAEEKPTEISEEKPTAIPEGTVSEIPEDKPTAIPEEEVSEIPEKKPTEISEEKPIAIHEEKVNEIPEEKPTEILEEKTTAIPEETLSEIPEVKPTPNPEEKVSEMPEERPTEISEEKPTAVPEGTVSEIPEDKPTAIPEEEVSEIPEKKPTPMPEEKVTEMPEERPTEISKEKPTEIHEEKVSEIPEEKPTEISEKIPTAIPEEKVSEMPEERPTQMSEEKPTAIPEGIVSEIPEEKPTAAPEETVSEIPEEKPAVISEEKPYEMSTEIPEEKPSNIPEEKPTEISEGNPSDMPVEKLTEITEEKPSESPHEKPVDIAEEKLSNVSVEKPNKLPEQKPVENLNEIPEQKPSNIPAENPSEVPEQKPSETPEEEMGTGSYGQEPDYVEEDQAFGPGTCRYGGKVYVSAQQIPRDDPCDFCFCFRSDIICLQQSCPPPIHGCHEEPIQGFCCPRYECPVSMATTLNVTTTTTTTTTTLPPHFPTHAYKGAAHRKGCLIKGHTYKVGEVVRASSGPCLHCTCGGDGQMKCDPKACTPEPMLRQMIAAAVSAKRRR